MPRSVVMLRCRLKAVVAWLGLGVGVGVRVKVRVRVSEGGGRLEGEHHEEGEERVPGQG